MTIKRYSIISRNLKTGIPIHLKREFNHNTEYGHIHILNQTAKFILKLKDYEIRYSQSNMPYIRTKRRAYVVYSEQ